MNCCPPPSVIAGDTWSWAFASPEYLPSEGWSFDYALNGPLGPAPTSRTISATVSGDGYVASVTSAVSAAYAAGEYAYAVLASKAGERYTLATGRLLVKPNPASAAFDHRGHAQRMLELVRAAYQAYISSKGAVKQYQIGERSVTYQNSADILRDIAFWEAKVAQETRAENVANGKPARPRLLTRFH